MKFAARIILVWLKVVLFVLFVGQNNSFAQKLNCEETKPASIENINSPAPITTFVKADDRFLELRKELINQVQKGDVPSVSVGVFKEGRVLWEESIGWANKENQIPATPCTPYGIASLGKSLTATAVMVLVNQGKVDLNAPISKYLGNSSLTVFEGSPDQVTIRRILNMTAAIPHGYATFQDEKQMQQYSENLLKNRGMVVFPAGEVYMYSNFSFAILEELIEKVSGKSYSEFLATEVFNKLGMAGSFVDPKQKGKGSIAPAERYGSNGKRLAFRYALPQNSLAMFSSIDGLLNFAMFHLNAPQFMGTQIFGGKLLDQMHRLRGEAPHSNLALGIGSGDLEDNRLYLLSNGNAGGIQSTLLMIPANGFAVVCLVNSSNQLSDQLAFRITDMIAPGFLEHINKGIGNFQKWANAPYQPTKELIGEWKGVIETNGKKVPIKFLFQPDSDIHIKVGDQSETILSDAGYRMGLLSGDFMAEIPMEESAGHPGTFTISLKQKDDRLFGFVNSTFTNEKGSFSIAAYVRLQKVITVAAFPR